MPEDLTLQLERALEAEGGAGPPDLESVVARGRRIRLLRRSGLVLSMIVVLAVAAVAWSSVVQEGSRDSSITDSELVPRPTPHENARGEVVEEMTEQEQAEVFAFRAVAATGLMNTFSRRSYGFTYREDTTRVPEGWRIGFAAYDCEPRHEAEGYSFTCRALSGEEPVTGNALTDTFVVTKLEGGRWTVVGVEGKMPDPHRNRLVGFSLPRRMEPSHWEFPAVSVWDTGEEVLVESAALWVGPYPSSAPGSVCEVTDLTGEGEVFDRVVFYQEPPNREFERAGWIRGLAGADEGVEQATVECRQYTGRAWEIASAPELVTAEGEVVAVSVELVWRGDEGFTTAARCHATLLDDEGRIVWEGSGNVLPLWREEELKDYPYRTTAVITTGGEPVAAESIGDFNCRSI